MFNSNAWVILYYDMWPNVNMPHGILNEFNTNIDIRFGRYINKCLQTYTTYLPTYLGKNVNR
jgi:hypothetical protein